MRLDDFYSLLDEVVKLWSEAYDILRRADLDLDAPKAVFDQQSIAEVNKRLIRSMSLYRPLAAQMTELNDLCLAHVRRKCMPRSRTCGAT